MSKNITTPSFLTKNPDRKDHGSIKAPSLRHPGVDQQSFRMATQDPFFQASSVCLFAAGTAAMTGETAAYQISKEFIKKKTSCFLIDAGKDIVEQVVATAARNAMQGKGFTFKAEDIDIANAFIKGLFGRLSKSNPLFITVEEALKTYFDSRIDDLSKVEDLSSDKRIGLALAELGMRLTFKFLPDGTTAGSLGKTIKNPVVEITVSTVKSHISTESQKNLTND